MSWRALSRATVQLRLNASYNPFWFTYNELSQITPLPIAWDRTSLTAAGPVAGRGGTCPTPRPAGAKAVYGFLNGQATKIAGYASSPLWSVVDGPWKLASLTSDGTATFVPNPRYSGPDRPHLAKFVELPFTSADAEFSVLQGRAGDAAGRAAPASRSRSATCPTTTCRSSPRCKAQGYQLVRDYPFGFDYFEPNFNNPKVGPILRQLYFRQAFQHLVDQTGWIHAYYDGLGVPTYSPVPASPAEPVRERQGVGQPVPVQRAGRAGPACRARLEDRPERRHHLRQAGHRAPASAARASRPASRSASRSCTRAACPTPTARWPTCSRSPSRSASRSRWTSMTPATIAADDRALRPLVARLQLGARQLRQRLAVRARSLPERRRDLPDRRARQRQQLLGPGDRQADHGDHAGVGERRAGGARRLRRSGPAAAAGLLAAEPRHADHGPVEPARRRRRTPTASSTRRSGTSRRPPGGPAGHSCIFQPATVTPLRATRAGLHLRLTSGAG